MPSENSQMVESWSPPRVEITVERLDGIVWSTPERPKNREELKKRVPFVTATVEFSGTCPDMKVFSASTYPHCTQPAVESYFASLAIDEDEQGGQRGNEVTKITSTTTQDVGGRKTTTTTTTITKIQAGTNKQVTDGNYPLVAKWYDDSSEEKLIDSVTYFTSPPTFEDAESKAGSLLTQGRKRNRPHLTLNLPSAGGQQRASFLSAMFAEPCKNTAVQGMKGKHYKDNLVPAKTHSTAASTLCSGSHNGESPVGEGKIRNKLTDAGSLLDKEDDEGDAELEKAIGTMVTRKDEAIVEPVVATKKSKEMVASVIAAEPSSAVVGQTDKSKAGVDSSFAPLSWMDCGTAAPEIIELRVRVMPEDYDEYDEMDPEKQHLVAAQDLEGVAHLVFLDQIVEEGTTVMDLPLKISDEAKAMTRSVSTIPMLGDQEFVTLGANAMLRVRVSILPPVRKFVASPRAGQPNLQRNLSLKTTEAQPQSWPFFSIPFSLSFSALERVFNMIQCHRGDSSGQAPRSEEETPQNRVPPGPFPHEFPAVVPADGKAQTVESFLPENALRKTAQRPAEPWTFFKPVPPTAAKNKGNSKIPHTQRQQGKRQRNSALQGQDKRFYTLRNRGRSSSSTSSDTSTVDEYEASEADSEEISRMFIRSLQ
ncbi:expressed unknown protein [Seminavis robusta]|uniref:Uncharacterized protein n=1 Tax=Seminavis robusta TaxID=568900 RepID=A0A9N8DDT7_9STRA|nr:expressed unknown protein [Seminavis robusta]|eukprot:Sro72_g040080.1 n/a (650) ;mRNA; f:116131-118080